MNPIKTSPVFKKTLYLKKINLSSDKTISKKIFDQFENTDNYFSDKNSIIVGKKVLITPINDIPENQNDKDFSFSKKQNKKKPKILAKASPVPPSNTEQNQNVNQVSNQNSEGLNPLLNTNNTYEILDINGVRNYFEKVKKNLALNKAKAHGYIMTTDTNLMTNANNNQKYNTLYTVSNYSNSSSYKKLPKKLKTNLKFQSNTLKLKYEHDRNIKMMENAISKRTSKKVGKDNFLLSSLDKFNVKKQLIKSLNSNLPIIDSYGDKNWYASLRRGDNFTGRRKFHLNFGSDKNPFWSAVEENIPNYNEIAVNTESIDKNLKQINGIKEILKKKHSRSIKGDISGLRSYKEEDFENCANQIKQFENLKTIALDGKNLLDWEYKNAIEAKGLIILKKNLIKQNEMFLPKNNLPFCLGRYEKF